MEENSKSIPNRYHFFLKDGRLHDVDISFNSKQVKNRKDEDRTLIKYIWKISFLLKKKKYQFQTHTFSNDPGSWYVTIGLDWDPEGVDGMKEHLKQEEEENPNHNYELDNDGKIAQLIAEYAFNQWFLENSHKISIWSYFD